MTTPIAQYLFQDNANDQMGNYTSTASNVTYESIPAGVNFSGKVAVFNGSNAYIQSSGNQSVTDNTIEFWSNLINITSSSKTIVFLTSALSGTIYGYQTFFSDGGVTTWERMPSWNYTSTNIGVIPANQWHHIVFVKTGTTRIGYLDGVEISRQTGQTQQSINLNYITLGARFDLADFSAIKLANVRIYNSVLSAAEILKHYQEESSPPQKKALLLGLI